MKGQKAEKEVLLKYLKQALNLNLEKVYFGYAFPLPDFPTSLNFFSRIIMPLDGESIVISAIDGAIEELELSPGTVLFTGKNGWANGAQKGSFKSFSIVFMDSYIRLVYTERVAGKILRNIWFHSSEGAKELLLHIILALNKLMMEADRERQARAKALIEALLLQTLEEFENDMPLRIGKADKTFRMIIEHMRQNYFLPVNRESVCRDLGLNPSYVSSLFKKKSGENFNSCLNRLRMEEAMSILKNYPDIDVKTLAQQCGFSDHGYFIKVFKKFYGSTPGKISFSQNP